MIFLRFEAIPSESVAARDGAIGAFVNCWVAVEDADEAEDAARDFITDAGWHVVRIDTRVLASPDDERDPDAAERIREAREQGGCVVFHTWGQRGEPVVG